MPDPPPSHRQLSPPAPPAWIIREGDLAHEVLRVPEQARTAQRRRWLTRAAILALIGVGGLLVLAGLYLPGMDATWLGVSGIALVVVGTIAWFADRGPRADGPPTEQRLILDRRGVELEGRRIRWVEVTRIAVEPYPFIDASYVYCVTIASKEGAIRLGAGLAAEVLADLQRYLLDRWRSHRRALGNLDREGLEALDELLGQSRVAGAAAIAGMSERGPSAEGPGPDG